MNDDDVEMVQCAGSWEYPTHQINPRIGVCGICGRPAALIDGILRQHSRPVPTDEAS